MALQVFKCLNDIGPSYLHNMFERKSVNYDLRDDSLVKQNTYLTVKYGFLSFRYHGAKIWNSLPVTLKSVSNFNDFKHLMCKWEGPICSCQYCSL